MKKKSLKLISTIVIAGTLLAGCSGSSSASKSASSSSSSSGSKQTVTLGVVGSDKDFWVPAQKYLKKEGINLKFVEFTDYTTPNKALNDGDIDLNAFQHEVYLNTEIKDHGYKIQNIGYTVLSPLNLYSQKVKKPEDIKDGDTVAVPNDPTNEGRALKVLEQAGLLKLKDSDLESPTLNDVASYKVKINIKELAADSIAPVLPDVTAAIINGNYASDYGYTDDDAIFKDSGSGSKEYWNLIAARTSDLSDKKKVALYKKVVDAFHRDATVDVFNDEFKGAYIAVGWDQDLLKDYE